jgi:hypothetical protein
MSTPAIREDDSTKRKNKPQFSHEECLALAEAYSRHSSDIKSKLSSTLDGIKKKQAWNHVLDAVNAVSLYTRTLDEVKTKQKNMTKDTKRALSGNKVEIKKTGGGSAKLMKLSEAQEILSQTISPTSVSGIPGGIDMHDSFYRDNQDEFGPTDDNIFLEEELSEVTEYEVLSPDPRQSTQTVSIRAPQSSPRVTITEATNDEVRRKTPKSTSSKRRVAGSQGEELLERQVNLFEQQLEEVKKQNEILNTIGLELSRRNQIEESKLSFEKG